MDPISQHIDAVLSQFNAQHQGAKTAVLESLGSTEFSNDPNERAEVRIKGEGLTLTDKTSLEEQLLAGLPDGGIGYVVFFTGKRPARKNTGQQGTQPKAAAFGLESDRKPLPGVGQVIAVSSGKGGVGKSTVSAHLALALKAEGHSVAILDADLYGPSTPKMFGVKGPLAISPERKMIPAESHGISIMSFGFMAQSEDTPYIARGPMVSKALNQLLFDTAWPDVDYLVIDMPPGTGDIAMTLIEKVEIAGAIVVTTPQDIALIDARKGVSMFNQLGIRMFGVVENMAYYACEKCGHHQHPFGQGKVAALLEHHRIPLLAQLPLKAEIAEDLDRGDPVTLQNQPELAQVYRQIISRIVDWQ